MTLDLGRQNAYRERYRAMRSGWRPATEVYEATIRAWLPPDGRVVDMGCGRGGVLEQLDNAVTHPIGLDPDWLSLHEHRMSTLPRAVALAEALPLKANSLDLVLCSWVFEHLTDPGRVFAEFQRVLRPGGRAIFLTPNGRSLVALLNRGLRPLQRWLVPKLYGRAEVDTFPVCYRANTSGTIRRLAAQSGLACEQILQIADPTYLAFHPLLFRASVALARISTPVHLIGVLRKLNGTP